MKTSPCTTNSLCKTKQGMNMEKIVGHMTTETNANNRRKSVAVLTCHFPWQSPWSTRNVPVRNDAAQKGAGELARRWIKQSCGVKGHVDQRLCDQQSCLVVFCKVVQTKLRRILQAVAETTAQRRTKTCMPVCDASSWNFTGCSFKRNFCSWASQNDVLNCRVVGEFQTQILNFPCAAADGILGFAGH